MNVLRPFVSGLMMRALRGAFRRICWAGPPPDLPEDAPVFMYANHHNFYDGYLAHVVTGRLLGRPATTWMQDWDRFPFFGVMGALPFPEDDARRRAATIRRTVRRLRRDPRHVAVYFPEGRLHRPEEGVLAFRSDVFSRLDALIPGVCWWPVGFHVTWGNDAAPSVVIGCGRTHGAVTGDEADRLRDVLRDIRGVPLDETRTLLEGRRGPDEQWNFSWMRPWFEDRL